LLTDLDGDKVDIAAFHHAHASVELAIGDLKEGAGLDHVPAAEFRANSAWLQIAVLAHNLIRWTAPMGQPGPLDRLTVARTVRRPLLAIPGRLVNRSAPRACEPQPAGPGGNCSLGTSTPSAHYQRRVHSPADWRPATTRR
jgi:hypothetical protein